MRTPIVFSALALSLAFAACGGSPASKGTGTSGTQAATLDQLHGSWTSTDGMNTGIQFNADTTFFRDATRILNGVMVNGGSSNGAFVRTTGTYEIQDSTLILHDDSGTDETFNIDYKPQPILNGVFLPGKAPTATIALTPVVQVDGQFQPNIAFPTQHFRHPNSWCTSNADCSAEFSDGSWAPFEDVSCQGNEGSCISCSPDTNACLMQPASGSTTTAGSQGGGGSNCEVEEGGSCLNSADDCTNQGGTVSGNDCTGSTSGGTVCCDLPTP